MELAAAATGKKTYVAGLFSQFIYFCKCMSVVNFFPALNLKISIVVTIQSASSNIFSSFFLGKEQQM